MKKTGQFKPIGALTKEPEITLAPGEIIKRVKKVGVTLINGKKVEIIQAEVIKATASTRKLIQKSKKGTLTPKELKTLTKELTKETGFKAKVGRRTGVKPRARFPKRVPRRPDKRPPKRPPKRPVGRPPVIPPKAISPIKRKLPKRKPRKIQAYNVYARPLKKKKGRGKPKLIRVNKVPLKRRKAKNLRNYITDTSLSRTARIKKTRGKPGTSRLKVPRGYAKKTAYKFRTHRIIKGRRKPLPRGKVIEKRKRLLDTRGEKKGISLRRRIKQIARPTRKPARSPPKRTQPNRQVMLNNLAKARRVRASNIKKNKKR